MFKAELKEKWGHYCNTDELVDSVRRLLTKYQHRNTEFGVCRLLDTYFTNKQQLIDMFISSEHYVGNMRICLDVELERENSATEVKAFCERFLDDVGALDLFLKFIDENGKTVKDYEAVGFQRFNARSLLYGDTRQLLVERIQNLEKFRQGGETKESYDNYVNCYKKMMPFHTNHTPTLTPETAEALTQHKINATFVTGMKTSRAFNRFCHIYKIDTLPEYNKMFAQYSDMVSGLKRKLKFFISLNPLDYLTMSFGKSWASCHTIDQTNRRGMPNAYHGMYCGGTVSYMLDSVSIITYIHDHYTEDIEEGKVYRNMFHYHNGTLIQGRIYPQGNDGATDLYKTFRSFMQKEFVDLLNLNENMWLRKKNGCCDNAATNGVHYADYYHFESCNVTYPAEMPSASGNVLMIGHPRICPHCGEEISNDNSARFLSHDGCLCFVGVNEETGEMILANDNNP